MARLTLDNMRSTTVNLEESEVELPGLGGTILIRQFTRGDNRRMLESSEIEGEVDSKLFEINMFRRGIVDPPMEGLSDEDIVALIDRWPQSDVDAALNAIMDVNGMSKEGERQEAIAFREG